MVKRKLTIIIVVLIAIIFATAIIFMCLGWRDLSVSDVHGRDALQKEISTITLVTHGNTPEPRTYTVTDTEEINEIADKLRGVRYKRLMDNSPGNGGWYKVRINYANGETTTISLDMCVRRGVSIKGYTVYRAKEETVSELIEIMNAYTSSLDI